MLYSKDANNESFVAGNNYLHRSPSTFYNDKGVNTDFKPPAPEFLTGIDDIMDYIYELWEGVRRQLKLKTSDTVYAVWLENLKLDTFDGETVRLTDDPFRCKIVNEKFISLLEECFESVIGFRVKVLVEPKQEKPRKQDEPQAIKIGESQEYTFDNFIVGDSNKFAHAAARAVATDPGHTYNPLFIHGNSGLGKTHLLNAICCEVRKNNPDANIIYVRSEDFTNELIDYLQNKRDTSVFHNKYRNADVLLVDDIQFIAGKPSTEVEFFNTFDTLVKAKSQIVLTSDRPPKEMATLEERLRNRFESGLIADIQPPDLETRVAIVKSKAESLNIDMPDNIAIFIAEKVKNNIRQLEGAVKNMQAQIVLHGAEPNMATVQASIRDIFNEGDPTPLLIEKIINEVCRTYGIRSEEIKSRRRNSAFTTPRHVAIYIISEMTDMTNKKIASVFNMQDHTSVIYAQRKISEDIKTNYTLRSIINDIKNNVANS